MKIKWMQGAAIVMLMMVAACGNGKQKAAVQLDEARLNISSAKKAGADMRAAKTMRDAEVALQHAEADFKKGKYKQAASRAKDASMMAQKAQQEAAKKAAPAPKATKRKS